MKAVSSRHRSMQPSRELAVTFGNGNEEKQNGEVYNLDMKNIKMPRNCFAVLWVKCGVLPNCEAVGLVSTLGNQVVFWEERYINKKNKKDVLCRNLLLRQTLLKYSVGGFGTICAWPSGPALSWDNRHRDSDHLGKEFHMKRPSTRSWVSLFFFEFIFHLLSA